MNRRLFRRSSHHALLLLLAALQLAAPLLHATTMAHGATDRRDRAFCGVAAAALIARLPDEVRAALAAGQPDALADPRCDDCVCSSAGGPLPSIAAPGIARSAPQPTPGFVGWRSISDHAMRLPPATGPPPRLIRALRSSGLPAAHST
ncbi:hypothetical protein [Nevskia ramosa]|uniref:hypothetical protein n=1 Tax=Nevskia ramosa TaxID=64002 RepID=UPI003D142FA8